MEFYTFKSLLLIYNVYDLTLSISYLIQMTLINLLIAKPHSFDRITIGIHGETSRIHGALFLTIVSPDDPAEGLCSNDGLYWDYGCGGLESTPIFCSPALMRFLVWPHFGLDCIFWPAT